MTSDRRPRRPAGLYGSLVLGTVSKRTRIALGYKSPSRTLQKAPASVTPDSQRDDRGAAPCSRSIPGTRRRRRAVEAFAALAARSRRPPLPDTLSVCGVVISRHYTRAEQIKSSIRTSLRLIFRKQEDAEDGDENEPHHRKSVHERDPSLTTPRCAPLPAPSGNPRHRTAPPARATGPRSPSVAQRKSRDLRASARLSGRASIRWAKRLTTPW